MFCIIIVKLGIMKRRRFMVRILRIFKIINDRRVIESTAFVNKTLKTVII
jgi:hypothetical protein